MSSPPLTLMAPPPPYYCIVLSLFQAQIVLIDIQDHVPLYVTGTHFCNVLLTFAIPT